MDAASLIRIDLGKHCFHLHAQDASGRMVFRKKLTRSQMLTLLGNVPCCTVVMEACAGAHWVARRIQSFGHQAKLISPQFVKPFLTGNKNDFADAQAICEAASRPSMRSSVRTTKPSKWFRLCIGYAKGWFETELARSTRFMHSCWSSV